jgi:hypothetical protein
VSSFFIEVLSSRAHRPPTHEKTARGDPAAENAHRDPAPWVTQLNHARNDEGGQDEEHNTKTEQGLCAYSELTHAGAIHESVKQSQ